ncbi:MAG: SMP-30/gluconolactonase/LRE family protein [Hyphomicrobiales bacterium]|nr:SMP-30/gluconolactonase/LRE family protein [Hyphomicrobiales bacterium]MBV8444202.1 SMP-30/gluconolactonase/LRE family protein [Hyphomicrobiales bacterium]
MGPRLIFAAADVVGESAVYDERRDALVWVDIGGKRIHRLYLSGSRHEVWPAPDFPTSIGLRADGGAVVGLRDRVALWDFGGEFRTLAIVEPDLPDNRLNEGRVGPDGAFWAGTMQNNLEPDGAPKAMTRDSGAIYRIDGEGRVSQLTPREFGIANTMAWTDDERFLTADTTRNAIYAYDFRAGALLNKRLFATPLDRGAPDGSCLDTDGFLWNCRVAGGACLARFRPHGELDRLVELPCTWPTSCVFGGPGFATLYVTSARFTMTAEHIAAHPEEGALFAVDASTHGRPEHRFG